MSVCAVDDGSQVTEENCPLVPLGKGPSTDRLLGAEHAVIKVSGEGGEGTSQQAGIADIDDYR